MNPQESHFQLKLLTFLFLICLAAVLGAHGFGASDIVMTALIGVMNTSLGFIGGLITKDRPAQRADDKLPGPENRTGVS